MTTELKIKIDQRSFKSASDTAVCGDFGEFEQKAREFCDKFMLVCNSCNEETLKTKAETLLPDWCRNETVIDLLRGKLSSAMKSSPPELLDIKFIQNFFLELKLPDNVRILLNDAGFGKTTYFTWLAWHLSSSDPSLNVVMLNAIEFSTDFFQLLELLETKNDTVQNLSEPEILILFYRYIHLALFVPDINKRTIKQTNVDRETADRCAKLLKFTNGRIELDSTEGIELSTKELIELRLFREKFNRTKLILIFDGFDEIAPNYKDVVLTCLARFAQLDGVQSLYLSSRPYGFETDLKRTFDRSRWYRLKLLSQEKIVLAVHNFLRAKLKDYKHYEEKHRLDVLKQLCECIMINLFDVANVPLLLYMVLVRTLDVIRARVNEHTHSITRDMLKNANMDILHLVECFINRKIEILVTDKAGITDSASMTAAAKTDEKKEKIKNRHILLAMCVMFDSKSREQLLSKKKQKKARKAMKKVNEGDEKTGLVLGPSITTVTIKKS
uniref:NACHT domain-containing protein n=1 Tax=Anopheles culicifacies TaxID=139723 RepID=A0A182MVJ0_9DIPT